MYLMGVGIMIVGMCLGMVLKHMPLQAIMNPVAIILHLAAILGVLTATRSFGVLAGGFKAVVLPASDVTEEVRGRAASLFRLLSKTCAFATLIGVLIGVIRVLADLSDLDQIGAGLTTALVSPVIGLLLITVVFEPAVFILKQRPGQRINRKQ